MRSSLSAADDVIGAALYAHWMLNAFEVYINEMN